MKGKNWFFILSVLFIEVWILVFALAIVAGIVGGIFYGIYEGAASYFAGAASNVQGKL